MKNKYFTNLDWYTVFNINTERNSLTDIEQNVPEL